MDWGTLRLGTFIKGLDPTKRASRRGPVLPDKPILILPEVMA